MQYTRIEKIGKNSLHKIYLIIAIFIGISFSVFQPLFSEADGVVHFVSSSVQSNMSIDLTTYGIVDASNASVSNSYRNNLTFEQFYVNKVNQIPSSQIPINLGLLTNETSFAFVGHLIPSIGVWIGYHIYPSLGVMITFARLLNMFILTLGAFFIIKFVKRSKLLFMLVFLCPVFVQQLSSLSYDSISFLGVAGIIAYSINVLSLEKFQRRIYWQTIVILIFSALMMKTNFLPILLVLPIVILIKKGVFFKIKKKFEKQLSLKILLSAILLFIIIATIAVAYLMTRNIGGFVSMLSRFALNFSRQMTNSVIGSMFVSPIRFNYMPIWITVIYFILAYITSAVDSDFYKGNTLFRTSIFVIMISVFGTYYKFLKMGYIDGNTTLASYFQGAISGVQGRYFLPLIFLLPLGLAGNSKLKMNQKKLIIVVMAFSVLTNALLLFNNIYTAMNY